jgi:hypothetical protein
VEVESSGEEEDFAGASKSKGSPFMEKEEDEKEDMTTIRADIALKVL